MTLEEKIFYAKEAVVQSAIIWAGTPQDRSKRLNLLDDANYLNDLLDELSKRK